MAAQPAHLTPAEAVERLAEAGISVSEDTLRRWARAKRLAAIELPSGRLLFRVEDIDAIAQPTMVLAGLAACARHGLGAARQAGLSDRRSGPASPPG
jgi:hypothetical protein